MVRQRWRMRWLTAGLSVSLLMAVQTGTGGAVSAPKSDTGNGGRYWVTVDGGWSSERDTQLVRAGGQSVAVYPELSGALVTSARPEFKETLLQQGWNVRKERSLPVPEPLQTEANAVEGEAAVQTIDELDASWSYHWDMQQIMADGSPDAGQAQSATGQETPVVALIGSGVTGTHGEVRGRLIGGVNLVSDENNQSESGDPADIRDRSGNGERSALLWLAHHQGGKDKDARFIVYRIYPERGLAREEWLVHAIVNAINEKVNQIVLPDNIINDINYQLEDAGPDEYPIMLKRALDLAAQSGIAVASDDGCAAVQVE